MTTTTHTTALTTIRAFFTDLRAGLSMLVEHARDLSRGVSSARKAMQLHDLSNAELRELGITRDQIVEYSFRDEI